MEANFHCKQFASPCNTSLCSLALVAHHMPFTSLLYFSGTPCLACTYAVLPSGVCRIYLCCICLSAKIASVVDFPFTNPNCSSMMLTMVLIRLSCILIGVNITALGRKLTLFSAIPLSRVFFLKCPAFLVYFELEKIALCTLLSVKWNPDDWATSFQCSAKLIRSAKYWVFCLFVKLTC